MPPFSIFKINLINASEKNKYLFQISVPHEISSKTSKGTFYWWTLKWRKQLPIWYYDFWIKSQTTVESKYFCHPATVRKSVRLVGKRYLWKINNHASSNHPNCFYLVIWGLADQWKCNNKWSLEDTNNANHKTCLPWVTGIILLIWETIN